MSKEKEVKRITLGGILSWIFGVIFGLAGLGAFASSSFVAGITLLIMSAVLLPPVNKLFREKMTFELSKGIKIAVIIVGFIVVAMTMKTETTTSSNNNPSATTQQTQASTKQNEITIVSNSFDDFIILCDTSATNLQKRDIFDRQFKNNYVEWTGRVSSISESMGSYILQVKHCPSTFMSDIVVTMKDNQKDNLLKYTEGDSITYRAKLTRLGDILGLSAIDGIVIE
jgi:hypothetical protein